MDQLDEFVNQCFNVTILIIGLRIWLGYWRLRLDGVAVSTSNMIRCHTASAPPSIADLMGQDD